MITSGKKGPKKTNLRIVEFQRPFSISFAFDFVNGVHWVLKINCWTLSRAEHEANHSTVTDKNLQVRSKPMSTCTHKTFNEKKPGKPVVWAGHR